MTPFAAAYTSQAQILGAPEPGLSLSKDLDSETWETMNPQSLFE
ncbi:MAG: hypothetical protein P4L26_16095 [Terracidiphilus sp.]|nr:hypothetical protein [Terracidiphilus sp.]